MQYIQLGNTGLKVSRLCFGCMSFGTPGGPTHPWVLEEDKAQPFFKRAIEAGINFFDTANYYNRGDSEKITGRALKKYIRRDEVVIATKLGLPMGESPTKRGLSRKHIIEALDHSLKRLDMDYVDILYVHRLDNDTPDEEMLGALDTVIGQGKVLYPAASSMRAWQFAKLREKQKAAGFQPFVAMQNFYNLIYREEEREMMPYCASENIAVVPWSPIARGFLAGNKPRSGKGTHRAQIDTTAHDLVGAEQDYTILENVLEVAKQTGHSPAQIAYAWVLSKPFMTSPIIGSTKINQLDEAIAALEISLSKEQIAMLEKDYRPRAVMGIGRDL
jgi:aryl-alcohol dehydrogenase-like predicted oxidoreductase